MPIQHTFQPHPDVPLTLAEAGEGRPAFVLHGGRGLESVVTEVAHLAANYRVLTPTHPGFQGSPRPAWFAGVDRLAETYMDLLDDLDLRDVVVLGCSFGGWIAAEMALRDRGHRISRLILMGAIGPVIPEHPIRIPSAPNSAPAERSAAAGDPPRAAGAPGDFAAMLAYTGPDLIDPGLLHRLSRVRIPALLVWGEEDTVATPDFGRAYAAAFSDGRFVVIPGGSHIPTIQNPTETLAAIDAFLTGKGKGDVLLFP